MLEVIVDHLVIAAPTLKSGSEYLSAQFGRQPTMGGSHPRQGTQNALLALEDNCYLEVLAPDPLQGSTPLSEYVSELESPALLWWAVRTESLNPIAAQLQQLGLPIAAQLDGSRILPQGAGSLQWSLLIPGGSPDGNATPFFISWPSLAKHPSRAHDSVGQLSRFRATAPRGELLRVLSAPVLETGESTTPSLHAELDTINGTVTLASPRGFHPAIGELLR